MSYNIDSDLRNADWAKVGHWDLHGTPEQQASFVSGMGHGTPQENVDHFMQLPAAVRMPQEVKDALAKQGLKVPAAKYADNTAKPGRPDSAPPGRVPAPSKVARTAGPDANADLARAQGKPSADADADLARARAARNLPSGKHARPKRDGGR